jgi:hypothetical protein
MARYTRRRVMIAATAALGGQLIEVRLNTAHSQEEHTGDARMVDFGGFAPPRPSRRMSEMRDILSRRFTIRVLAA